ncbi:hypothetical protein V8E54_000228 [Elaphomyces granulatus]
MVKKKKAEIVFHQALHHMLRKEGQKSIEKEEIHGLHDELRPLLWKPRLDGLNNINLNVEAPAATAGGPSTQILPTPTATEVNGDDFRGENNDENSDVMSTLDDAELSADGGQQNGISDQMSEKRKGKRFRLTANQTRFLMSEFTRQAHPDAAHRERLSREIPGFSPRQVQVWFQNRRAKLKRLTSRDRERMLKSRALPDDFDMARVLHQPYAHRSGPGMHLQSPRSHPASYSDSNVLKPLGFSGIKRENEEEYTISPASTTSYGNYTPSPTSCAPSENMSAASTSANQAAVSATTPALQAGSHANTGSYSRSHSFSASHPHAWNSAPGFQSQRRGARPRAESLNTLLQTGMSYSGNSIPGGLARSPHGMVFNYDGPPLLQSPVSQAGPATASTAFGPTFHTDQTSQDARTESFPQTPQDDDSRVGLQMGTYYRQISTLQTAQLPLSSFSSQLNFDSIPPFPQGPPSGLNLPASSFRSDARCDPPK